MLKKTTKKTTTAQQISHNQKKLLNNDTPFAVKESYVKLRTNLLFCMTADKHRRCKVFAVSSSRPSEGKSLTAANVAISFAMLGKKTVLIDADLRKPTQHRLWRVGSLVGLCDFLADIAPLEMLHVDGLPLDIVCAGTIPPNPSELLTSDLMKQFVNACSRKYEYIVIDTPPINTVADAQVVSAIVDGLVIVAKSGSTTSEELSVAIETVNRSGGNLCGVVLNGVNMKSAKYAYRYKESDKYAYNYSYSDSYPSK